MPLPGATVMRLLTAPEYETGSTFLRSIDQVTSARITLRLDNSHGFTMTVPEESEWLSQVKKRRVIWIDPGGVETVSEWYIKGITQAPGRGQVTINCDPLLKVLRDVGIIEDVVTGSITHTNLGGVNLSARNYISTYVVPQLTAKLPNAWIGIGTTDPTLQFTMDFDGITPREGMERIKTETATEWRFRRNSGGSNYLIDVLDEIGSALTQVWLSEGLNVLTLVRERQGQTHYTAIRPMGALPDGSEQRADIGFNTWEVTGIASLVLTVSPNPLIEDDQHIGLYVEKVDGTWTQIDDSDESASTLTVASASGISVGDHIMIVADSAGTLLTEISSPSGDADAGYIQGVIDVPNIRGERNQARNPAYGTWSSPPVSRTCLKNTTEDSTSLQIDGLPASHPILIGDAIWFPSDSGDDGPQKITANTTANGSGEATITVDIGMSIADNTAGILVQQAGFEPSLWDVAGGDNGVPTLMRTVLGGAVSLTGDVDGNQTIGGTSAILSLDLKNMTVGAVVPNGALITGTANGWVMEGGTVGGDGKITLVVAVIVSTAYTDGVEQTISVPELGGTGSTGYAAASLKTHITASSLSQDFQVRFHSNLSTLNAIVRFVAYSRGSAGWDGTGNAERPRLQITDSGGSELAGVDDADWSPSGAGESRVVTLSTTYTMSADFDGKIRFRFPYDAGGVFSAGPLVYVRSFMVYIGNDPAAPFVDLSHATEMFQQGNLALLAHRQWPTTYTATVTELVDNWGIAPDSPALDIGGTMRVRIASLGLDVLLRCVAIEYNPLDPKNKTLTLDSSPEFLTKTLAAQKTPSKLFVNVDIEVVSNAVRKTVVATEDPPLVTGVQRAVVNDGAIAPTDDAPLAIAPVE